MSQMRTTVITGHPPIRSRREPEAMDLGPHAHDAGRRSLCALRLQDGRLLLWHHLCSGVDGTPSGKVYLATLSPAPATAGEEECKRQYADLASLLTGWVSAGQVAEVHAWLARLGYASVMEVD